MCALFTIFKCNLQHIHRSIIITISRAPRNCFSFGRQSLFYFVRIARFPVCCFGWLFVFSLWIIQLSFNGIKVLSGELFVRATRKIYSVQRLNSTHTHTYTHLRRRNAMKRTTNEYIGSKVICNRWAKRRHVFPQVNLSLYFNFY